MKSNPSQLGLRYLPFLVVAAVMLLLVVITPSKSQDRSSNVASEGFDFSGGGDTTAGGDSGAGVDFSGGQTSDTVSVGAGDQSGVGAGGVVTTTPAGASGGGATPAPGSGGQTPAPGGGGQTQTTQPATSGGEDLSKCDANGMQVSPVYPIGVRCRPVFTGDNGGATMKGVTATEIRYTWYNPTSNPVVDGILAGAGFARTSPEFCDAMRAFERSTQKYFEMSGRTLVPVDGPGEQAGSADCGNKEHYPFFQSQCPTTPDSACLRANATVIADEMGVAFVLAPRGSPVMWEEMARRQTVVIGYNGSRERHQQFAPYLWGTGLGAERVMTLHSEFFCKRLNGSEPEFGGDDVIAFPGTRKVGLVYPDNGDGALKPAVDLWLSELAKCGAEGSDFTYVSDAATAPQQAANVVAQMRAEGVTTMAFCCDPVSMTFFLSALDQNRYYPEHVPIPVSTTMSDVVGQIAIAGWPNQWSHAFGISNFAINRDDTNLAYRRAYEDGGGPGGKSAVPAIEIESFDSFLRMMQMVHTAGPQLTPVNLFQGMQDLPAVPGNKLQMGEDFVAPDPFTPDRDVAEVWYNPNLRSDYNGNQGAMCLINNGVRYDFGQIPTGRPPFFGSTDDCAVKD